MRIPVATPLLSRNGSLSKDAKCLNKLIESTGPESPPVSRKRPGMQDKGLVHSGTAQLLQFWNGNANAIIGDTLNTAVVVSSRVTTWNPSDTAANIVLSGGNLTLQTFVADTARFSRSVLSVSSGTWYFEVTLGATVNGANIGLANATAALISDFGGAAGNGIGYRNAAGIIVKGGSTLASVATSVAGDVIGVYYNADAATISWYKNNVLLYTATGSNVPTGPLYAAGGSYATANNTFTVNFGATTFVYGSPGSTTTSLSPTTAGLQFTAQDNGANAAQSRLMFKNATQAWTLDTSGNVTLITDVDYPGNYTVTLTSLTRNGTVATATTATATNFQVGSSVTIAGATPSTYNGAQTVTGVGGGTVTSGGANISITLSRSGTTATATTVSTPHGYINGQTVTIAGALQAAYNGSYVITWISATQFSYTVTVSSNALASPATGSPAISFIYIGIGSATNSAGALNTFNCTKAGHNLQAADTVIFNDNISSVITGTVASVGSAANFVVTTSGVTTAFTATTNFFRTNFPTVSSITSSAGVATVTTSAAHRLASTYSGLSISGCTQTAYNVINTSFIVLDATHFTYVIPGAGDDPVTPATGTITSTGAATIVGATFTFTIAGSPATPATGTITATGGRTTVPGIAYLDGYFNVMDVFGVIYSSAIDDPTNWNALVYTTALAETGAGKCMARTLNYLAALKEWSTEFFYDRQDGQLGSPFSPVPNGFTQVGCASGDSVAHIDGSLIWVSQVRERGRSVHLMQGTQQQKVSTPDVERVLNADDLATVRAYGLKIDGHPLYILTLETSGFTLVYDVSSQVWSQWSSLTLGSSVSVSTITRTGTTATVTTATPHGLSDGDPITISGAVQTDYNGIFQIAYVSTTIFTIEVANSPVTPATGTILAFPYTESYWKFTKYANCNSLNMFLHESDGHLYQMLSTLYQDNAIPINEFSRSIRMDGANEESKRLGRIIVVGDKVADTMMIRWSDDDCTTFAAYRRVNLNYERAAIRRCGGFRRRTLETRYIGNNPNRTEALELEVMND